MQMGDLWGPRARGMMGGGRTAPQPNLEASVVNVRDGGGGGEGLSLGKTISGRPQEYQRPDVGR